MSNKIVNIKEIKKIREIMKFNNADELRQQMANDAKELKLGK
jgi:FAD synthase